VDSERVRAGTSPMSACPQELTGIATPSSSTARGWQLTRSFRTCQANPHGCLLDRIQTGVQQHNDGAVRSSDMRTKGISGTGSSMRTGNAPRVSSRRGSGVGSAWGWIGGTSTARSPSPPLARQAHSRTHSGMGPAAAEVVQHLCQYPYTVGNWLRTSPFPKESPQNSMRASRICPACLAFNGSSVNCSITPLSSRRSMRTLSAHPDRVRENLQGCRVISTPPERIARRSPSLKASATDRTGRCHKPGAGFRPLFTLSGKPISAGCRGCWCRGPKYG